MKKAATKSTSKKVTRAAKKPAPRATGKQQQIIVLVDGANNYYEVPRATLERSRVKEDRSAKVVAALRDVPSQFAYIAMPTIPGSTATAHFEGARQLHYAGFYLKRIKSVR